MALVNALIVLATAGQALLHWIGVGMTLYGLLCFLAPDGLVHKCWLLRWVLRSGYLKRLYQAHRLHHAVRGPQGCVSFCFLWAPSPAVLKRQLQASRATMKPLAGSRDHPPTRFQHQIGHFRMAGLRKQL